MPACNASAKPGPLRGRYRGYIVLGQGDR